MDKVIVKYPKYAFLSLLVWGLIIGFVTVISGIPIVNSSGVERIVYILITFLLFCLLVFGELFLYNLCGTRIILDEEGLSIINIPLKKYNFHWNEILEFGKSRFLFRCPSKDLEWIYYIKSSKTGERKIILGGRVLKDINKLCDFIFKNATNAKFVILEDTSNIPFIRKHIPVEWNRREGSKETFFGTK